MGVTITGKKIVLEFPKEEFEVLEPAAIEKEVFNELKKLKAVKDFSSGKISEKELVRILGPEKALNIIEAKEITEKSIKRAINEYKKRVGTECFICDSQYIMLEEAKNNKTMTNETKLKEV